MKLIPQNDYITCEKLKDTDKSDSSFFYSKDEFPRYKILAIGNNLGDFRYSVNDQIVCNSTGTKVKLDDSDIYLFKAENIIGKVN